MKEAAGSLGGDQLSGLEDTATVQRDVAGGEASLAEKAHGAVETVTDARRGRAGT